MHTNRIVALVRQSRNDLMNETGLDVFAFPDFMEAYIARVLGGAQTRAGAYADAVLRDKSSTRIEVKSSNIVYDETDAHPRGYFTWHQLRGRHNKKDTHADFLVLIGYIGAKQPSILEIVMPKEHRWDLWVWVAPYKELLEHVGRSGRVEYKVSKRPERGERYMNWVADYLVGYDEDSLIDYFKRRGVEH